jgi:hypothetical protein
VKRLNNEEATEETPEASGDEFPPLYDQEDDARIIHDLAIEDAD